MPDVVVIGAGPGRGALRLRCLQTGAGVSKSSSTRIFRGSRSARASLPQCMEWLDEAGLLHAVVEAGFQHKNGAIFQWGKSARDLRFSGEGQCGMGNDLPGAP